MGWGLMQNDFLNTNMASVLLSTQGIPACILKIEGNFVTDQKSNDEFVKLIKADLVSSSAITLQDIYQSSDRLSTIISQAVKSRGYAETRIQLHADQQTFRAIDYLAKCTYLLSHENTVYVLHTVHFPHSEAIDKQKHIDADRVFRDIMENTSESIIMLDKQLMIFEFSMQSQFLVEEYFDFHLEKGKSIFSHVKERQLPFNPETCRKALKGESEYTELFVPRLGRPLGKISIFYKPLMGDGGEITGVFISVHNVTERMALENNLHTQDIDLSLIYNHLSETVFMITVEDNNRFRFGSVNRAFLENTGLSESAVVGHLVEEVIPEPYLKAAMAQYRQAVDTKAPVTREEKAEYPSGLKISIITVTPYCDTSGSCTRIIGSIHDITGRVIAEKNAVENSVKLQGILDSSPDIICTLNSQGILYSVSAAAERILGYTPDSLIHRPLLSFVALKYHASTKAFLLKVARRADTMTFENELIHKNGLKVPVIWSAHWNVAENRVSCTVREAREKKNAEKMLALSEKRFKAMVHDGSDMIAILDNTAKYLYVSPSSKSVLDYEPEIFLGQSAFEFIHPDDVEKASREFATAAGQKKVSLSPFRFRHNNGSWRWIQTVITDLRQTPAIKGFVANSRDVSGIVESQNALKDSNERYRYVSKATSDAIWDYDLASGSLLWGDGFLKIFGYSGDMLHSNIQTWISRIHPDDARRVEERLNAFLSSGETNWRDDYKFLKADGNYAHVVDKGFVIRDIGGSPVRMIGAKQDITVRKKEEARLRVLESVVTNTIDAVIIAQIQPSGKDVTRIIFVNKAFERLTGYLAGEVEGRSPWFLQGSGSDRLELEELINSIKTNKPYQGMIINYKKNGAEIWVSYSVTPVADGQGVYTHWITILRDFTEAKNLELKQSLLAEINSVFNSGKGLSDTLLAVLSKISEFGKFGFASLWTNDSSSGQLEPAASLFYYPHKEEPVQSQNPPSAGACYALQIKNNGKQGFWKLAHGRDELARNDIRQVWGIPLYHYGTFIGVLLLGTTNGSDLTLPLLPEDLGNHLGTEIHRKKLEQDLEHIFNLAPDIIAITDFSGNFKKLNPAASKLLGFSMDELLSRPFSCFLHPEEKQLNDKQSSLLRESGKSYYIEERYLTMDGRSKWLGWTSQPLKDERLVYSVAKDITEKKELEQLLLNSNSLARIGSWEITFPEKKVSWSTITKEIMQAMPDYIPGRDTPLGEFYPQFAMEMMDGRIRAALEQGRPWDEVLQVSTIRGELKWVRSIGSSESIDGRCLRIFGSLQDIDLKVRAESSAKEARAELEESEKRYSELFHLSPLPMWVYDFESLNFLDVNQTAISSYGYSKKEFLSMNIRDIRPTEEIERLEKTLEKTRKKQSVIFRGIFKHRKKNGENIQVDIKSNTVIFKGKMAKVIIASDITERLRQFQAIEHRNEKLREVAWIQSHKVRAPLARLMGLVQMLSSKTDHDPEVKKILDYIDSSAGELDQVIREAVSKSEELDKSGL